MNAHPVITPPQDCHLVCPTKIALILYNPRNKAILQSVGVLLTVNGNKSLKPILY